jgi:predicted Zn finger-like uncharacterized protein
MDLTTQCPQCNAIFAASLADLQLRKGYIRCPNCAHIFDGFEAVVSPSDSPPAPQVVRQRPASAAAAPRSGDGPFSISGDYAGSNRAEPTVARHGAAAREPLPAGRPEPALGRFSDRRDAHDNEPSLGVSADPSRGPADNPEAPAHVFIEPRPSDSARAQPDFLAAEPIGTRTIGFYFWSFLSLLGIVLLLLQGIYVYRVQLANQFPAMRPVLQAACAPLHCRIPYVRDIDAIQIMNSALQSGTDDGASSGGAQAMTLRFTLRNTLDKPQEWPTMVFSLLDFSGTVVVKKNIEPSSYLSGDAGQGPFAAHAEVVAAVPVTINGVKVSGFKLSKFFP